MSVSHRFPVRPSRSSPPMLDNRWRRCRESMVPEIPGGNSWEFWRFYKFVIFLHSDSSIPYYVKSVFFQLRFGEQAEQHWTVSSCYTFWSHGNIEWLLLVLEVTNSNVFSIMSIWLTEIQAYKSHMEQLSIITTRRHIVNSRPTHRVRELC